MTTLIFRNGEWVEGTPSVVGEVYRVQIPGGTIVEQTFPQDFIPNSKIDKIQEVKEDAGRRIEELDWQLQRARRHVSLGKVPKRTEAEVLQLQQDIEEASDAAEIAINALTTIDEIRAFTW